MIDGTECSKYALHTHPLEYCYRPYWCLKSMVERLSERWTSSIAFRDEQIYDNFIINRNMHLVTQCHAFKTSMQQMPGAMHTIRPHSIVIFHFRVGLIVVLFAANIIATALSNGKCNEEMFFFQFRIIILKCPDSKIINCDSPEIRGN